jgi:TPR repeat protein
MSNYDSKYVGELQVAKNFDVLNKYLEPYVKHGNIQATLEMAFVKRCQDKRDEGLLLAQKAEKLLLDSISSIWIAYQWRGLGAVAYEESEQRGIHYLTLLAYSNNILAQETLMINYLEGKNGVKKNIDKFLYWADQAKLLGSKLATSEIKKYNKLLTK